MIAGVHPRFSGCAAMQRGALQGREAKPEAQGHQQHRRDQVQDVGVVREHPAEQHQSAGGEPERGAGLAGARGR